MSSRKTSSCVVVIENVFYMKTLIIWQLHKTDKLSKAWDQVCYQSVVLLSIASVVTIVSIWPWNNCVAVIGNVFHTKIWQLHKTDSKETCALITTSTVKHYVHVLTTT